MVSRDHGDPGDAPTIAPPWQMSPTRPGRRRPRRPGPSRRPRTPRRWPVCRRTVPRGHRWSPTGCWAALRCCVSHRWPSMAATWYATPGPVSRLWRRIRHRIRWPIPESPLPARCAGPMKMSCRRPAPRTSRGARRAVLHRLQRFLRLDSRRRTGAVGRRLRSDGLGQRCRIPFGHTRSGIARGCPCDQAPQ